MNFKKEFLFILKSFCLIFIVIVNIFLFVKVVRLEVEVNRLNKQIENYKIENKKLINVKTKQIYKNSFLIDGNTGLIIDLREDLNQLKNTIKNND